MATQFTRLDHFHCETQAFFKDRLVCVAGGSGFAGSHAVDQLLLLGAQVRVLSRNPSPMTLAPVMPFVEVHQMDLNDFEQIFEALCGCETLLDFSGYVGGVSIHKQQPATVFQENLQLFMNLMKASRRAGVKHFHMTSSACVYPGDWSAALTEDVGTHGEPQKAKASYGWAKRMQEYLAHLYHQEFGLRVSIARPSNLYGPRDHFAEEKSHVVAALIRKAVTSQEETFSVLGHPDDSRCFLYIEDMVRGSLEVAARQKDGQPINITSGEEMTIRDLAEAVGNVVSSFCGKSVYPRFESSSQAGHRHLLDSTRARKLLGFKPRIAFDKGLQETVRWYLQ